jgi:tRNA threonylcarbamoyladenosine biosynthesis protein TsaB
MILCLRADSPEVYIGIWDGKEELSSKSWEAGRELSLQILDEIDDNCDKVAISIEDIDGIIVYEGPGSYTGLRISISVANSIGYSNNTPVIGSTGDDWIKDGMKKLDSAKDFSPISPVYGGEVYTTEAKKVDYCTRTALVQ